MRAHHVAMLPDGRRLHLQDGPIDLVVGADGDPAACRAAFERAAERFATILDELCAELPLLRRPVRPGGERPSGAVARRMSDAVAPFADEAFVTPMAAVAGAVAEAVLEAMLAGATPPRLQACTTHLRHAEEPRSGVSKHAPAPHVLRDAVLRTAPQHDAGRGLEPGRHDLTRAYVNNGGDIALHLAPGERFRVGLIDGPDRPGLFGTTTILAGDGVGGIATSGWRGRSFSLGIADAVTVLAGSAAEADAAATIIANAVDLPGHPAILRVPAIDIQPDSDLGGRPVTRAVGLLDPHEIDQALARGLACADALVARGLVRAVALHCAGETRLAGGGRTSLHHSGRDGDVAGPAASAVPTRPGPAARLIGRSGASHPRHQSGPISEGRMPAREAGSVHA